jgi:predicted RND superfamily exporter protein
MTDRLGSVFEFVTEHNVAVVLLMLVLSGGVVAGITQMKMQSDNNNSEELLNGTTVGEKQTYVGEHYANRSDEADDTQRAVVYIKASDGNVLSKASLLESLRYQKELQNNASVATLLPEEGGVTGVSNLVAKRAAGSQDATLDEQIAALESASESDVQALVERTLKEGSPALGLLSSDYEPGTASAESRRMVFQLEVDDAAESDGTADTARAVIYDSTLDRESPDYFTIGSQAWADRSQQMNQEQLELILPIALAVILAVLVFSYRDLVDVIIGFTGVVLSVLWMFGILGWLQIPVGATAIIGPVLIVGLSVDYGLHVFMRYREQRGAEEGIREPMARGLSSVSVALVLVTLTTAIGFLSNATSDWTLVQNLAFGITLGVVSTLVVSLTLVPALKVTVDRLLGRVGFERRKSPLGTSGWLAPLLSSGAVAARKAAPVVIVLALLVGAAGGAAWTQLDRESFQSNENGVAEWKQDLPEPLAYNVHELDGHTDYVAEHYQAADESDRRTAQILVEGDVASETALDRLHDARASLRESDVVFDRNDRVNFVSPVTVMQSVAQQNDAFADVYRSADTDGDGVPDRNVEGVYNALYEHAPEQATLVVERTDGDYRSVRMLVPITESADYDLTDERLQETAATLEGDDTFTATAISPATMTATVSDQVSRNILQTLLLALAAVFGMLMIVYRLAEGSATLGAVTAIPIALVSTFVVGGMYVFDVPLTFLTALLMSLVIGLGIDYNIHISDRFAQERDDGHGVYTALRTAVTGTGGALLGSTLTSTGAFAALLLHPHPQIQSFGTLVVLALGSSFLVSVFVLPSLLVMWSRLVGEADATDPSSPAVPSSGD